jgi:hypothetical protein
MRILATVYDFKDQECFRLWLNGASEQEEPLCALEGCIKPLGWSYPYCDDHLKQIFGVCIRPSGIHGYGLFACRDFQPNENVVPFGGELVEPETLQQRYTPLCLAQTAGLSSRAREDAIQNCVASYAICTVRRGGRGRKKQPVYIDALRLRHAWAYANHHGANPNCEFSSEGITSRQFVARGSEILVDYGPQYKFSGRISHFILP